jgi:pyruvate carboxylase
MELHHLAQHLSARLRAYFVTGPLREQIIDAAVRLAARAGYTNVGTFEFLVDLSGRLDMQPFFFIEANARLQVEHTVTEAVTGIDLVQAQIRLARGATLREIGLEKPVAPRGYAIQARVNMETIAEGGSVQPSSGALTVYEAPSGPGVRTDGFGYAGYRTSSAFDSLLAKVIAHSPSPDFAQCAMRASRALREFRLEGVATNMGSCAIFWRIRISCLETFIRAGWMSISRNLCQSAISGTASSMRPAMPDTRGRG